MQDLACPVSGHVDPLLLENQCHDPSKIAKETTDVGRHWRLLFGLFIFFSRGFNKNHSIKDVSSLRKLPSTVDFCPSVKI